MNLRLAVLATAPLLAAGCSGAEAPAAAPVGAVSESVAGAELVVERASREVVPADRLEPAGPVPSQGRSQDARLSIPAIGLDRFVVRTYEGTTDDADGTAIQDAGALASPTGPTGGTGPGGVGNYLVTGHRLSSTQPFLDLPDLARGDRVRVVAGGVTYVYAVRGTRRTSFRSPASLAAQRAAVPGRPGVEPTRAMLTLSTCATPEDHAVGNYWSDEHGNPEHRIDKTGVLVAVRGA